MISNVPPIRALDKRLRDGRRFTLDLVPQHGTKWAYWMQAAVDGEVIHDRFTTSVERDAAAAPGLPHVIMIQFQEPSTDLPGQDRLVDRPVGLTDAEADAIDAACAEWCGRYRRAALEAAPDAPTWNLQNWTVPLAAGHMVWDAGRGEPVMVLRETGRYVPEDGRSFGLDDEEGYLFGATVRALTPHERAEWDGKRDAARRMREALQTAEHLFGWDGWGPPSIPADATPVDYCRPKGETVYMPEGGRCLIRDGDTIYTKVFAGGTRSDGVSHPATPARIELLETLLAASDRGDLH